MRLAGQVAVVVGASSGIGAACAAAFAKEGAAVVLGARTEKTIESRAAEIRRAGGKATAIALDVRDEDSVKAFAAEVRDLHGSVDLLLNGAGVGLAGTVLSTPTEDWDETIDTNLRGAFLVLREVLPLMFDGPRLRTVLNVASVSGTMAMPGLSAYAASKWGLRGLSQSVAMEVADRGIRVVAVNPGFVDTPMVAGARYPAKDMIQVEEFAETMIGLATLPASVQVDDLVLYPTRLYTS